MPYSSWRRSLKTRVTLFTLAIFLISIWSLEMFVSSMLREDMQRVMGEQQFSTATLVAEDVNVALQDRLDALLAIAEEIGPAVSAHTETVPDLLRRSPILLKLFNGGALVIGIDGTAIADIPVVPGRVGTNYMDRESTSIPLKEGISVIGRPVIGRVLNAPIFSVGVPIHNNQGGIVGALVGVINLGLPNFLDKITSGKYGETGGYLLVDTKHKLFVTASDKTRVMQPTPVAGTSQLFDKRMRGIYGPEVAVNSIGVENLSSAAPIPVAQWFVITSIPTQEAFGPIRNVVHRTMMATTLLTLLAGGLTWWWLRRQVAPILMAAKTLTAQLLLNTPPQPLPITSQDEIGDLIGGFNRLTERLTQREEALHQSELYKQAILNSVDVEIAVLDQEGVIQAVNQPWLRFAAENRKEPGKPVPNIEVGTNYLAICRSAADLSADGAREALDGIRDVLEGRLPAFAIDYGCHSPTQQRWFNMTVTPLLAGRIAGAVVAHLDISERKEAESALKRSEDQMSISQQISGTGSWVYNLETDGIWGSAEAFRIFGFPAIAGDLPIDEIEACIPERERVHQTLVDLINEGRDYDIKYAVNPLDGSPSRVVHSIARLERGAQGRPVVVLGFIQDITERSRMEEQVRQLAFVDPLTQLPNRRLLDDRLDQALTASKRSGAHGALLFVDLDNFKPLNDAHGHGVGDLLLIEAASRLMRCVREMDTVSRFGGDEFVVLLRELAVDEVDAREEARMIAEKICISLARPYLLTVKGEEAPDTSVEHRCTASIGVVTFGDHDATRADIIRWADSAMYQAKASGRNAVRFHEKTINS